MQCGLMYRRLFWYIIKIFYIFYNIFIVFRKKFYYFRDVNILILLYYD